MEQLPPALASELVEGLGAYLRSQPPQELPARLRPIRTFTPAALKQRKRLVLSMLEDETQRALLLEWLRNGKPPLPAPLVRKLEIAAEQEDGWVQRAAEVEGPRRPPPRKPAARSRSPQEDVRSLREELKHQKTRSREELAAERERARKLASEVRDLQRRLAEVTRRLESVESGARREQETLRNQLKRATRSSERAAEAAESARAKLSEARKELAAGKRRAEQAERALRATSTTRKPRPKPAAPTARSPRRALKAPAGRLEDDPATLRAWLGRRGTRMLVDGYNVALRAAPEAELAARRDLLVDELERLTRTTGARTTVVFDGDEVPPGTRRRSKRLVTVEYSRPNEIADDHLIARLQELPPDPVVVVTDDRELRERAAALGATIATSDQLLSLLGRSSR